MDFMIIVVRYRAFDEDVDEEHTNYYHFQNDFPSLVASRDNIRLSAFPSIVTSYPNPLVPFS